MINAASALGQSKIDTNQLDVALKEWHVVCQALAAGRQMILLRKGGIFEAAGGFELEHRQFLLFPTYLHQKPEMLKDEALGWYEHHSAEPEKITITLAAEVTDIIQLKSRAQMDRLDGEHIWTKPLIEMRFNYKPQNPLYLLLVRAYRLAQPTTIDNTPAYAGCKSWVPLHHPIETRGVMPSITDQAYSDRRQRVINLLASAA